MDWGGPEFVLSLIVISTIGWVLTTAIRAKHGYPITSDYGGTVDRRDPEMERKIALLSAENGRLTGQIGRLEERISVLERIATDAPTRLGHEIDSLR